MLNNFYKIKSIMKKTSFIIAFASLLLFCGCKDDIKNADLDIHYNTSLGLPIGKANFGISDLIAKSYEGDELYADASSRYYFMMQDSTGFSLRNIQLLPKGTTVSAGEKFSFEEKLGIPIPSSGYSITGLPENSRTVNIKSQKFIDFSLQTTGTEERIDSAAIEHSELFIRFNKPNGLNITIKSFKINFPIVDYQTRKPISLILPNTTYSSLQFDTNYTFAIDDFMVTIEKNPLDDTKGGFTFEVEIEAVLEDGTIYQGDQIGYDVTYTIFSHKVVYGVFSPDDKVARSRAQLNFNLLRDINSGKSEGALLFDDAQVTLTLKNYDIGMDVTLRLDTIKGYQRDHPEKGVVYGKFDGGVNYSLSKNFPTRPEIPFSNKPSILTMTLDKDNGQIQNFFTKDFLTDRFEFVFSVGSVAKTSSYPIFITNEAHIDCSVDYKIPLNLRPESYYIYTDTIQGFAESMNEGIFQYVDSAVLHIGLENGLPIGVKLSLKLIDDAGNEIPSELNKKEFFVPKAETNKAGEVVNLSVTPKNFEIVLTPATMDDLKNAAYMLYTVNARNEDTTDNICFKEDNRFNLILSIFAKGGYRGSLTPNTSAQ